MSQTNSRQMLAKEVALLALTEIGLGSLVHGFHLPWGGHLLSLNQGFLLSRFSLGPSFRAKIAPFEISSCAAVLKSLSPMGKKLTPMLAISVQGGLFSLGIAVFGVNPIGIIAGNILLSLWGFVQPALIYSLLFGVNLWEAVRHVVEKLEGWGILSAAQLLSVLLGLVVLKILLATTVGLMAMTLTNQRAESYRGFLIQRTRLRISEFPNAPSSVSEKLLLALKEVLRIPFLFSMGLMLTFLILTRADNVGMAYAILRPIACGLVFYSVFQFLPLEKVTARWPLLANALSELRGKP